MIKIESLSKTFNGKKVINNLNLEIQKNKTLVLLGPNGSGKTTLLNIIAGLITPDKGNIYINNTLVQGTVGTKKVYLNPFERKIGYVFQTITLFPHMKIQDNIAYGLKSLHLTEIEIKKKTNTMLELVDLTKYAQAYPHQLSGGQQQRAALARSLATQPQIMLLDEPVSAVDPQLREPFRLELKKYLQTIETTTIYVTHNFNEAFIMADKIAILGNGHIEQIGNREEIFDKPQTTYVAKFLGTNIFKGKIIKQQQNNYLQIEINNTKLLTTSTNMELTEKNITITIKPENITLSTQKPTSPNTTNIIQGTLTEITQTLTTTQTTVDIGFLIKTKNDPTTTKKLKLTIGDTIYIIINPTDINILT
ncbi:MAG: ABC transporter ATP-binding protein [Nitrososphaerota archaeon]|jgi:ABC-type Fe3+/spermidine/putrescine transport system ATPase subunit|nr:ABC transporter ATP-binding protein [Nitrososphaerota archaeon]